MVRADSPLAERVLNEQTEEDVYVTMFCIEKDEEIPTRKLRRRVPPEERDAIWRKAGGFCYLCKLHIPRLSDWHIEHVIAFSIAPSLDVFGNMLPSHASCNLRKGARSLTWCVRQKGFSLSTNIISTVGQTSKDVLPPVGAELQRALQLKHRLRPPSTGKGGKGNFSDNDLEKLLEQNEGHFREDTALLSTIPSFSKAQVLDVQRLGRGGQADVFQAKLVLKSETVNIVLKPTSGEHDPESIFLARCQSDHTVRLYGTFVDSGGIVAKHYLVMEKLPYDLASDKGQSVFGKNLLVNTQKLVLAVLNAHENGVIHRDIHAGNVFIGPGTGPKLADFGLATPADGRESSTFVRSGVNKVAPEIQKGNRFVYTRAVDVWNIGQLLKRVVGGLTSISQFERAQVDSVIERALVQDPQQRATCAQLYDMLNVSIAAPKKPKPKSEGKGKKKNSPTSDGKNKARKKQLTVYQNAPSGRIHQRKGCYGAQSSLKISEAAAEDRPKCKACWVEK